MVALANFFDALAAVLNLVLGLYLWVLIARALVSWVNPDPYNQVVQVLYKLTEPVLYPVRRLMGSYSLGIDISPLVVMVAIYFLQRFLVKTLYDIAMQFR